MIRRYSSACLFVALLLVSVGCEQTQFPTAADEQSPMMTGPATAQQQAHSVVSGRYIVVLDAAPAGRGARASIDEVAKQASVHPDLRFEHVIHGFAANMNERAAEQLRKNPRVQYVEPDRHVHAFGTQTNATWGLDRVDQRDNALDQTYRYNTTGSGVTAYIIDTGIHTNHTNFTGRATAGFDAFNDGQNGQDCNGHGTHVAGTVGGTTWGIAKDVTLVAVRVLDCDGSGTTSGVIAGIDWVTADHQSGELAVANMSLGGGSSDALDDAVRNSISDGISYAVAAGNGNFIGREADACNYSPARVAEAITIGATDDTDTKASWSNYGSCVDWFAPGVNITSAWIGGDDATNTISGTSMATPHVAGVAALYLEDNTGASPQQVHDALYGATTKSIVSDSRTENNHLLYSLVSGDGGDGNDETNGAPTADFSYSTTDLAVDFTDTSSDSDGSVESWSWEFGDGNTSTDQHPSHTYDSGDTYTVTLTVIDDDGATGSTTQDVTVSSSSDGGSGSGITLSGSGYKLRGAQHADLTWDGATSTNVDVYRNGTNAATTANDGAYTDNTGQKGGGSATYQICEAGTDTCSNETTVSF